MALGMARRYGDEWGSGQGQMRWWQHHKWSVVEGDEGSPPMVEVVVAVASQAADYRGQ
jgi:hypothetical protein